MRSTRLEVWVRISSQSYLASIFPCLVSHAKPQFVANCWYPSMLQPHHSKLSHPGLRHSHGQMLPTGNNFGGTNLNTQPSKRFTPAEIIGNFGSITEKSSTLLIQILSLIVVTVWFWGLLAAVNIVLGLEKKLNTITAQKPERVPFMGTLTGS